MAKVSNTIWETCKTYLFTQGKFLAILWVLIAACMVYYFKVLQHNTDRPRHRHSARLDPGHPGLLRRGLVRHPHQHRLQLPHRLLRAQGQPAGHAGHPAPLRHERRPAAGRVELFFMICILMFLPRDLAGPCFIGFAIGESLGASVLRICGGIFTKIADIGSDLMKIVFKLPEDDPKNPGVIADCTGDNAGDSVGPTADGFETYGVTGVALIAFLALALAASPAIVRDADHLAVRHARADDRDLAGFLLRQRSHQQGHVRRQEGLRLRSPADAPGLDHLGGFHRRHLRRQQAAAGRLQGRRRRRRNPRLWWVLSVIISCGTVAGALIPEFTKVFVSTNSRHVREVTNCSKHGGASLNILSGFVAGNFSAFWMGLVIMLLMFTSLLFLAEPGADGAHAGEVRLRRADLRLRPGGLRLPGHGAGDHRGGQLRPGDRQRAIGL